MAADARTYIYTFLFPNAEKIIFPVTIDSVTKQVNSCPCVAPSWARLQFHQCSPCPLQSIDHHYCPVALSIAELVTTFKSTASYDQCVVTCATAERTVYKETTIQEGLASLLGLLMAISGCPIMGFFKPMAQFHLPFATVDETIFRIVAVYMLRQYYRENEPILDKSLLGNIKNHYALVKQVNQGILNRIHSITNLDADKNALVTLTSLGQILEMEIDTNLESLQQIFQEI